MLKIVEPAVPTEIKLGRARSEDWILPAELHKLTCCFDELFVAAPSHWFVPRAGFFLDGGGWRGLQFPMFGLRASVLRHVRRKPRSNSDGFPVSRSVDGIKRVADASTCAYAL
jgi:hypothetical protein